MNTDTQPAIATQEEIEIVESIYSICKEDANELDRIIGTYESYGGFSINKPALSKESI